jgi:hypothetical protein
MRYEYEETATRRRLKSWVRLAGRMTLAAGLAAGGAVLLLPATSAPAAAMSADDCEKLPDDALLLAVDQGLCTLDVLPSAGPAPQIADNGSTSEHDGGDPRSGGDSGGSGGDPRGGGGSGGSGGGSGGSDGGSGGSGGSPGDGAGGGDDGGDDGGDNGGDDGGSGGR